MLTCPPSDGRFSAFQLKRFRYRNELPAPCSVRAAFCGTAIEVFRPNPFVIPITEGFFMDSQSVGPILQDHRFIADRYPNVSSEVPALLKMGGHLQFPGS